MRFVDRSLAFYVQMIYMLSQNFWFAEEALMTALLTKTPVHDFP